MAQQVAAAERFRVGPPSPSGMRLVTDRIRSESFWVYPTLTLQHALSGHDRGAWYWKPLGYEHSRPVSLSYSSFEAALEALRMTQTFKDLTCEAAANSPRPS